MIPTPREKLPIIGQLADIDFDARTIVFRYQGDLPPMAKGRFAIVPDKEFTMLVMRLSALQGKP